MHSLMSCRWGSNDVKHYTVKSATTWECTDLQHDIKQKKSTVLFLFLYLVCSLIALVFVTKDSIVVRGRLLAGTHSRSLPDAGACPMRFAAVRLASWADFILRPVLVETQRSHHIIWCYMTASRAKQSCYMLSYHITWQIYTWKTSEIDD